MQKSLNNFLLIALLLILSAGMKAQVREFSLAEAQEYAVKNSYKVKSAGYDLDIADKKIKEVMAQGLPQVGATLDYNYFIQRPTSLIPGEFFDKPGELIEVQFGAKNNLNFGLQLDQLIFDGRYFIGLQYSKIYM